MKTDWKDVFEITWYAGLTFILVFCILLPLAVGLISRLWGWALS